MSSEQTGGDDRVGYGNPPKHTRFKPGQSGNPKGRPRKPKPDAASIAAILDAPVPVRTARGTVKMPAVEASLRKLVSDAVSGSISAAVAFLRLCDQCQVIAVAPRGGGVDLVPWDWDWDEWVAKYDKDGPPPWRGKGKRSGLPVASRSKPERQETRPAAPKSRNGRPLTLEQTVAMIAYETHVMTEGTKRRRFTTFEIVLLSIRKQATGGNLRAFRAALKLLKRYAPDADAMPKGRILLTEDMPPDEWERMVADLKAKGYDL